MGKPLQGEPGTRQRKHETCHLEEDLASTAVWRCSKGWGFHHTELVFIPAAPLHSPIALGNSETQTYLQNVDTASTLLSHCQDYIKYSK